MIVSLLAARYTKAIFDLAIENNVIEETLKDMQLIGDLCAKNRDFRMMLKSPVVSTDKKLKIFKAIFENNINSFTLLYLQVIVRKNREAFIQEIAMEFEDLYNDYRGVLTTHITTASPLTDELRNQVIELMKKNTDKKINLVEDEDPELVGGYILKWKDLQYDASILSQINQMRRDLARKNLYIRGF